MSRSFTSLLIFFTFFFALSRDSLDAQQRYTIDFENGLGEWTTGADVPADPNNDGLPVRWEIQPGTEQVFAGRSSLRLFLDGRQDDGTIWIARTIPLQQSNPQQVTLNFHFWSPFGGSFNTLAYVVAYIGPKSPHSEGDFTRIKTTSEVDGWGRISHTQTVEPNAEGTVYVAVGFSVVWESEQTYYLDDVTIEVGSPGEPTAVRPVTWGQIKAMSFRQ